jgi:hypothetical protein
MDAPNAKRFYLGLEYPLSARGAQPGIVTTAEKLKNSALLRCNTSDLVHS